MDKQNFLNDFNNNFQQKVQAFNAMSIYLTTYGALDFLYQIQYNQKFDEFEVFIIILFFKFINKINFFFSHFFFIYIKFIIIFFFF